MVERIPTAFSKIASACIRAYQLGISPLFPASCRFYPSCSEYALQAVRMHGAGRSIALVVKRICRCNPWNAGGFDPVPERPSTQFYPSAPKPTTKDTHGNP
ncbi:MAG: membrane protein insertion efficiency factor YidD [Limnobacter sp.]|nr:membrane protein insertion efficiency factor YidD [Limnobacter sp.]